MPEIRVQDEQGTIHVFPDGSTPEMISQAMGLKPPTPQTPEQKLQAVINAQNPAQNKANFINSAGQFGKAAGVGLIPGMAGEAVAGAVGGGALGLAANAGTQALTSGGLTKLAGGSNAAAGTNAALGAAGPLVGAGLKAVSGPNAASALYQSALKPSRTIPIANMGNMIQTGLNEGIPVSSGGLEKISDLIDDLNSKISQTVASDPSKTINKFAVTARLGDTAKKFATQVNPEADLNAVADAGNEFLRNQPGKIPVADAQALKQGTYQQLGTKAYGEMKTATVEAQKALARGIKEELVTQFPELKDLNAQDSKLLDLQPVIEKAVQRIGNHQIVGIGTPAVGMGVKAVTNSNPLAATAGLMKAVLDNPTIKSYIAIGLSKSGIALPAATARVAALSSALAQASVANASAQGGSQ